MRLRADLAEASAPVEYWSGDEWVSAGYQVADAQHRPGGMLRLHLERSGHDYYGSPDCPRGEACTCLEDAVDGAAEVERTRTRIVVTLSLDADPNGYYGAYGPDVDCGVVSTVRNAGADHHLLLLDVSPDDVACVMEQLEGDDAVREYRIDARATGSVS